MRAELRPHVVPILAAPHELFLSDESAVRVGFCGATEPPFAVATPRAGDRDDARAKIIARTNSGISREHITSISRADESRVSRVASRSSPPHFRDRRRGRRCECVEPRRFGRCEFSALSMPTLPDRIAPPSVQSWSAACRARAREAGTCRSARAAEPRRDLDSNRFDGGLGGTASRLRLMSVRIARMSFDGAALRPGD